MLAKLTKHEFLTIGRTALPAYIGILAISLVGRFLTWLTSRQYLIDNVPITFIRIIKVLSSLISVVYVIAFTAFVVLTLVYLIYRFYRNYFTDEGYLMHTLPVKPISLIFSKLFNSWIWILFSAVIAFGSLWITFGHYDRLMNSIHNLTDSIKNAFEMQGEFIEEQLGVPIWVFVIELVLFFFLLITRYVLSWYSSVGFGIIIAKKHRLLGTIISYLIIDNVSYMLTGGVLGIITKILPQHMAELTESGGKALQMTVIGYSVLNLALSALLVWFLTYIFKRKLNLD
ncbi:MAG: hypothetical protein IKT24_05120 [Clostridia bacterium]|nr:hypothetical protein [Clostridia bacterium]